MIQSHQKAKIYMARSKSRASKEESAKSLGKMISLLQTYSTGRDPQKFNAFSSLILQQSRHYRMEAEGANQLLQVRAYCK